MMWRSPVIRERIAARYGLPRARSSSSRILDGLHFVFLDVVHWFYRTVRSRDSGPRTLRQGSLRRAGTIEDDLRWLEYELGGTPIDRRSLSLTFPSGSRRPTLWDAPQGTATPEPSAIPRRPLRRQPCFEAVRSIVWRHSQVKLCLAGHWHLCDATPEDGVVYCQTGAMCEYPFELRVVDIAERSLKVTTVALNELRFRRIPYVPEWRKTGLQGGRRTARSPSS